MAGTTILFPHKTHPPLSAQLIHPPAVGLEVWVVFLIFRWPSLLHSFPDPGEGRVMVCPDTNLGTGERGGVLVFHEVHQLRRTWNFNLWSRKR